MNMALCFDPLTGELTGSFARMTDAERVEFEACKAQNPGCVMVSPSDTRYADALAKQQVLHGFGWGLRQMWQKLHGVESR